MKSNKWDDELLRLSTDISRQNPLMPSVSKPTNKFTWPLSQSSKTRFILSSLRHGMHRPSHERLTRRHVPRLALGHDFPRRFLLVASTLGLPERISGSLSSLSCRQRTPHRLVCLLVFWMR